MHIDRNRFQIRRGHTPNKCNNKYNPTNWLSYVRVCTVKSASLLYFSTNSTINELKQGGRSNLDSKCQRLIILRESSRNVRKLCSFTMLWTQKERKRIRKDEFYIRIISMKSMETYHGKHVLKQSIYEVCYYYYTRLLSLII